MIPVSKTDLVSAQALVSRKLIQLGPSLQFTQALIDMYAGASLDFNPRHVDPVRAEKKQTVAHGLHGAALVPYLCSNINPFGLCSDGQCLLHEVRSIKFGRPIRPGSTVFCLGRIAKIEAKHKGLLATFKWRVMTGTNTMSQEGTYILLYR